MALLNKSKKVVVGLSGGVDSAVAAALLKQQGYEVVGIFMKFWQAPSDNKQSSGWNRCCSFEAQQRARAVARVLGIRFYVLNLEQEFKKKVVDYFLSELKAGRTPNPCVVCNKEIKFGLMLKKAKGLDCDYLATGHYARKAISKSQNINSQFQGSNSKYQNIYISKLLQAKDKNKDQTYFLWQLNQKQLAKILLPIGEITSKAEVRELAKNFNLPVAQTKESQEVCFIKDTTEGFLKKYLKAKPGEIKNKNGEALGQHSGLWFYTIGQRKGINIPAEKGRSALPYFVVAKDIKNNALIVSQDENDLLSRALTAERVNWISGVAPVNFQNIQAKIRYGAKPAKIKAMQKIGQNKYKIIFTQAQRAITPGQSVVFYLGDELLAGGIIV